MMETNMRLAWPLANPLVPIDDEKSLLFGTYKTMNSTVKELESNSNKREPQIKHATYIRRKRHRHVAKWRVAALVMG